MQVLMLVTKFMLGPEKWEYRLVKKVTSYVFRHSLATHLIEEGYDISA